MAINATQRMISIVFIDGSLADLQAILLGLAQSVAATVPDGATQLPQDTLAQYQAQLATIGNAD